MIERQQACIKALEAELAMDEPDRIVELRRIYNDSLDKQTEHIKALDRRAAMADELATVLRSIESHYWYDVGRCLAQPGGPCDMCKHVDAARTLLARYDAVHGAVL